MILIVHIEITLLLRGENMRFKDRKAQTRREPNIGMNRFRLSLSWISRRPIKELRQRARHQQIFLKVGIEPSVRFFSVLTFRFCWRGRHCSSTYDWSVLTTYQAKRIDVSKPPTCVHAHKSAGIPPRLGPAQTKSYPPSSASFNAWFRRRIGLRGGAVG